MIPARRPVLESDREFLWKLQRETMRPHVEAIWRWEEDVQRARFDAGFRPGSIEILESHGKPIGMIEIFRLPTEWFIARMQLVPELHGKGIGTALLEGICREADREQVPVRLQVLVSNPAFRLYERLGFKVVETTDTHRRMLRQVRGVN